MESQVLYLSLVLFHGARLQEIKLVGVENVDISFRLCLTLLSTHRAEHSIICSKSVCKHGKIYKDAGRSLIMQAPCGVLQYSYAGP